MEQMTRLEELEKNFLSALEKFVEKKWLDTNKNLKGDFVALQDIILNLRDQMDKSKRGKYDSILFLISTNLDNPTEKIKKQVRVLIKGIQLINIKINVVTNHANKGAKTFNPLSFLFRKKNGNN